MILKSDRMTKRLFIGVVVFYFVLVHTLPTHWAINRVGVFIEVVGNGYATI